MAKNEAPPTIDVKLFVHREKRKVLFAESDKEFVDVLFGFLTMPLGTVVRLLDKQSQMGCLDEVYKSVEDLSSSYFETKACKAMLLKPLNAASSHCCQLKINIDDTTPRAAVYVCKDTRCCALDDFAFSSVPDTVCRCGKVMDNVGDRPDNDDAKTEAPGSDYGVFVKGCRKFITTDDLQVAPASTSLMLSLCKKFGVQDPTDLDKTILQLTSDKITSLLRRSLTSKQALTGLHFDVPISPDNASLGSFAWSLSNEQVNEAEDKVGQVRIKVLQTKTSSAVLYAEVGHDFVDLVFGLLSVPLGSVAKAFCQRLPKGCIDNLYRSIDGCAEGCMRAECKSLLLSPELPPFFGSGASQILQVNEVSPRKLRIDFCFTCFKIGGFPNHSRCHQRIENWNKYDPYYAYVNCKNLTKTADLIESNPKSPEGKSGHYSAFVKQEPQNFMVTDHLRVSPLSLDSSLRVVSEAKIQMKELVEKEVTLTKFQVMELQRAALMSRDALTSVLVPAKKKNPNHLSTVVTSTLSTVKVSNVSLKAAQRDIKEFFSFSGDIVHVEMQSGDELSQVAYITFKDNQGAETAMLLTGATIVDMAVIVTPANDYELPAYVLAALEPKDTKPSALQKAEDIVGTMLAKGFILGRDALDKAKALDEKHQLTSTATARVSSFDKRIGLSEKISVGTSVVNDKVKEMDQKYQVSEKTKSALAAAEQSVSTAGSAIMKNRYVLTGAAWVTGAFSKVTSAANDVGAKAKEKIAAEQEHKDAEGGHVQANISEIPAAPRELDSEFANIHVSETPEDIPISTATVPAVTDEEPSKASPPADVPKKPEAAQGLILL